MNNIDKVISEIEATVSFESKASDKAEDKSDAVISLYSHLKESFEKNQFTVMHLFESPAAFMRRCEFDEKGHIISLDLRKLDLTGDIDLSPYTPKLANLKLDGNPALNSVKVDKNAPIAMDFMSMNYGVKTDAISVPTDTNIKFLYTEKSLDTLDETLTNLEQIMSETERIVFETKPSVGVFINREPTPEEAEIYVDELLRQYEALRAEVSRLKKAIESVDKEIKSLSEELVTNDNIIKQAEQEINRAAIGEIIANIMKRRLAAVEVGLFGSGIKELKKEFETYNDEEKYQKMVDRIRNQVDQKTSTSGLIYACLNNMNVINSIRMKNVETACAALCYDKVLATNARNFGVEGVRVVRRLRGDYIRAERASHLSDPDDRTLKMLMNESARITKDLNLNYRIRDLYEQMKNEEQAERVRTQIEEQEARRNEIERRISDKIVPSMEAKSKYETQSRKIHIQHLESILGVNLDERIENCGKIIQEEKQRKTEAEARSESLRNQIPVLKQADRVLRYRKDVARSKANKLKVVIAKRNKKQSRGQ